MCQTHPRKPSIRDDDTDSFLGIFFDNTYTNIDTAHLTILICIFPNILVVTNNYNNNTKIIVQLQPLMDKYV